MHRTDHPARPEGAFGGGWSYLSTMAKAKAPSGRPWTPQYLRAKARHFYEWAERGAAGATRRCDDECRDLFALGDPAVPSPRSFSERNLRAARACESLAMDGR